MSVTEMASLKPIFTWRTAILQSQLPATTRHVALTLACHMNEAGGSAFPGTRRLEEETGLSRRCVMEHLRGLEEAGYLVVKRKGDSPGRATVYEAVIPNRSPSVTGSDGGNPDATGNPDAQPVTLTHETGDPASPQIVMSMSKSMSSRKERPRDPLWDAFADEVGFTPSTDSERGAWNGALKQLRAVNATTDDLHDRCDSYRKRFPSMPLTLPALVKRWNELAHTNGQSAKRKCSDCGAILGSFPHAC